MKQISSIFIIASALALGLHTHAAAPKQPLTPGKLQALRLRLRKRQEAISSKGIAYLWDLRMDPKTGQIGRSQTRFLQALCVLALAADGSLKAPRYQERLAKVLHDLKQPIATLSEGGSRKDEIYLGTSNEYLSFETHAVVAIACEQLAGAALPTEEAELFLNGAAAAIDYIMRHRKRGRDAARCGGWPVNVSPHLRNRPDRRCTAWQLLLLKCHQYNGAKANSTALKEAPAFIFAAQRVAPRKTEGITEGEKLYSQWSSRMRKGVRPPEEIADPINDYLEYFRLLDESGGFGLDTLGIVTPSATAVGLFTMGLFGFEDDERYAAAARAMQETPIAWDAQRFFLTQFFATRGLYFYAQRYGLPDYAQYMDRLLTLMEQKQESDGSFPLGSKGVEELTRMERVYTTAMCVLIANTGRGNLMFDRKPYRMSR